MKNISVIIPIYNEEENLPELFEEITKEKYKNFYFIFVNDGSTDDSNKIIENLVLPCSKIVHKKNFGLAAAVKSGIEEAIKLKSKIIVKVDADLQHDLNDIAKLINEIELGNAEIVYGDRFSGSINYRMELFRKVGNKFFSLVTKKLTKYNIKDSQPGLIAFTASVAKDLKLIGNYNYTQQILIESSMLGYRFTQVPITFNERIYGKSFISYKYPFKVFWQIFTIYSSLKPMKTFGKLGFLLIMNSVMIAGYQVFRYLNGYSDKIIQSDNLISLLFLFGVQTVFVGIIANLINLNSKT